MPPKKGKEVSTRDPSTTSTVGSVTATKQRISKTKRAGLILPVGRIARHLRQACRGHRVGVGAAVFMAAVLEYLTLELLEIGCDAARDNKKQRIIPRHLMMAIRMDEELNVLLRDVVFPSAGVQPNIHAVLLPKRSKEKMQKAVENVTEKTRRVVEDDADNQPETDDESRAGISQNF